MSDPCIVFGAFDRHNFGDLLLPHVVQSLWPGRGRACVFAGLAARDLRAAGGHDVRAIAEVAAAVGDRPALLLHAGGEVLTCHAWTAAAMLLPADEAPATVALLERDAGARRAWVAQRLATGAQAPYAGGAAFFRGPVRCGYVAVGGVDLDRAAPALRDEVFAALRAAAVVTVRDTVTLGHLRGAGIRARLLPDPAVMVRELFAARIDDAGRGAVAALRGRLAGGYLAVQCSAEFGDDATLDALARELRAVREETGLAFALFRAGTAPWHDDLGTLERLARRLPGDAAGLLHDTGIWSIAALIAGSHGVVASSLHARIVAIAYARPRLTMRSPASGARKHEAVAATWDAAETPAVVGVQDVARGLRRVLARPPAARIAEAARLADRFRSGFAALTALNQPSRDCP